MSNRIKAFISIALAVLVFVGTVPAAVAEEGYLAENEISTETDVDNSGEVNPENPDVDPDKPDVDPDDPNVEPDDPDVNPDNPNVDPNPEPDPDPNPNPDPDPEPEPEPDPKPDPKPTDVVGEIWLCSINGSGLAVGHMWVYILNTSDDILKSDFMMYLRARVFLSVLTALQDMTVWAFTTIWKLAVTITTAVKAICV